MIVARTLDELAAARTTLPRLALVPTMGALHAGHRSLVELAHEHADAVAVSIFVNPLQFGVGEDFTRYPRPLEADLEVCAAAGVDLVFAPTVEQLYPRTPQVTISAGPLGDVLEGASRPGHFDGVLTVVLKLLHLVGPDVAVFGRKDAQQLACIKAMVADLDVPVEIVGAPIVREADGLALSSRNVYLDPEQRVRALTLSQALAAAARSVDAGAVDTGGPDAGAARRAAEDVIAAAATDSPDVQADYVALVDPATFVEVPDDHVGTALLALAVRVGATRLIDNRTLTLG